MTVHDASVRIGKTVSYANWMGGRNSVSPSHPLPISSVAGSTEDWNALCRETGAIQANSLTEAVDILKMLSLAPPFTGTSIGVMGCSGASRLDDGHLRRRRRARAGAERGVPPTQREHCSAA